MGCPSAATNYLLILHTVKALNIHTAWIVIREGMTNSQENENIMRRVSAQKGALSLIWWRGFDFRIFIHGPSLFIPNELYVSTFSNAFFDPYNLEPYIFLFASMFNLELAQTC